MAIEDAVCAAEQRRPRGNPERQVVTPFAAFDTVNP